MIGVGLNRYSNLGLKSNPDEQHKPIVLKPCSKNLPTFIPSSPSSSSSSSSYSYSYRERERERDMLGSTVRTVRRVSSSSNHNVLLKDSILKRFNNTSTDSIFISKTNKFFSSSSSTTQINKNNETHLRNGECCTTTLAAHVLRNSKNNRQRQRGGGGGVVRHQQQQKKTTTTDREDKDRDAIELALDSVVKIFTVSSSPNYILPWQNKSQRESMGSGIFPFFFFHIRTLFLSANYNYEVWPKFKLIF